MFTQQNTHYRKEIPRVCTAANSRAHHRRTISSQVVDILRVFTVDKSGEDTSTIFKKSKNKTDKATAYFFYQPSNQKTLDESNMNQLKTLEE